MPIRRSAPRALSLPRRSLYLPPTVSRRTVLRGAAGAGALSAVGGLAACGGDDSGGESGTGTVTLGSRLGDPVPAAAEDAVLAAFEEQSGYTVEVNRQDNETFQESINNYLQGSPDDVFTWFTGFRARFFDDQGLVGDLSSVWDEIGDGYSDAFRAASSNGDKEIVVPVSTYPWALFYRPSVFEENGWSAPETIEDFEALCQEVQGAGLVPVAFGNQDGWPSMGTFDILNMRMNGYDFHIALMAGEEDWDTPEVGAVFEQWAALLPFHQEDPNGRTWQEAAQALQRNEAAMYFLGLFVGEQFEEGADRDDLDFFAFPEVDSAIGAGDIDAPIDGYMMAPTPENEEGALALLTYWGSAEAQELNLREAPNAVAAHSDADTSGYTPLQQKAVELIQNATGLAQFLDRDTRPDFASTIVIPTFQNFLNDPSDIDTVLADLQAGKERLFVEGGSTR